MKIWLISTALVVIDQLIKIIIDTNMTLNESITITSFFHFTYVRNIGAAFSMLSGNVPILIIFSIIALYFIYKYFIKDKKLSLNYIITYAILIAGIIGNLIDRIFRGYVIDYLDFKIFNYNFPIFNIADICIVIGCLLLILLTVKENKNENNS